MSVWLNNKKKIWKKALKPCHVLAFCPYGQLVEEFPLPAKSTSCSCGAFGHDCPVYYHAELMAEDPPEDVARRLEAFLREMEGPTRKKPKKLTKRSR